MQEFLHFWHQQGTEGFVRIFWFYFVFELPRYVLLDYFVLAYYLYKRKFGNSDREEAHKKLLKEMPLVSIIVPGKDEGRNYYRLVKSLEEQTYKNYEIILVDDGSTDDSELIGRKLEREGKVEHFLRNEVRGGKASAANMGLRYSDGEIIVHCDADCSLKPNALENILIPFYMDEKIGAVGGNLEVRNKEESICTALQTIEYFLTISVGRLGASTLGILRIISGAFGAFRKEALERVSGWDVGPGLDGDLTLKIRKLGYKTHFEYSSVALTSVPKTFVKLARQRIRWSRSLIRFRFRKHKNIFFLDKNFDLLNFLSIAENIFFNFVLTFLWYFYIFDIFSNFTQNIMYILIMGLVLYTVSKTVEFTIVIALSDEKWEKIQYFIYMPAMVFYTGNFIRFVRSWAYLKELVFRSSYKDSWNPAKTSEQARQLDI